MVAIDVHIEFFGPETVNIIESPLKVGATFIDAGYTAALVTVVEKIIL
jgi:hypothetical protein